MDHLLVIWPQIKEKYKDATLDICYGWDTFAAITANNPERQQWKVHMISAMSQKGITEHGRLGKKELNELTEKCGILAYPSHFFEIFCISVVNAQLYGCVPVTTSLGALSETVHCGVTVDGDINDPLVQQEYLEELLALMGDEPRRKKLSDEGREWAKQFEWSNMAKSWSDEFKTESQDVKVTVFTPSIRKGFWNIMCDNLSKQTYKNFEWIIVDDYPEDRSAISKEYAKKYNLDIKYLRGKNRKIKRTYGLCNANNTALESATGEIMVFLQDFILMPLDGLEQIVTLYRKNPDALQGLPDMYFSSKIKPDITKEDWFNGETNVVGEFIRQNIRLQNKGLRFTENPADYEQNYGAIPVKIARELGGWHEFFDEGLGFDNTEMAMRALMKGYKIIIDENNVAICIDHWKPLEKSVELGVGRERNLNDPRFFWLQYMIDKKKMTIERTQAQDDTIELLYTIPKEVSNEDCVKWMQDNTQYIIEKWIKEDHG